MNYKIVLQTFFSRFLILALNFGIIIFSTNIWGSEGKGIISLMTADLAIIVLISNIFAGSSVSYFAGKYKKEQILVLAYLWSIIIGITLPLISSFFREQNYLGYLMLLSVFSSLLVANINLFVGNREIKLFNIYTFLQLAVLAGFIVLLYFSFQIKNVDAYFIAQIITLGLLFLISSVQIWKHFSFTPMLFLPALLKEMFTYGWRNQLSIILQLLNNRLSFYFLEFFKGIASVGIFSVGVAFSEAVWTVSRSLAVILYSDVINSADDDLSIKQTKLSIKVSFLLTLLFVVAILLIPAQIFVYIFGKDFLGTKVIILILSPGILGVAVSNIIGHYFAGINKLKILNLKSLLGLVFMIPASLFVIPRWGILGASAVNSASYCLSSSILLWSFYQKTPFRFQDFMITKSEFNLILLKIRNRNGV